jgi:hypothetical protein
MSSDQRTAPRFESQLPMQIRGTPGETQNISATGIYFESHLEQQVGSPISFTVEFMLGGQRQTLKCEGTVVRVEPLGDRVGVAARMTTPVFEESEENVTLA